MSEWSVVLPQLGGELELIETYAFYDEPVLCVRRNSEGTLYLAVAADETWAHNEEDSWIDEEVWLYAEITPERLDKVKSCEIDLYDAFKMSELPVWAVTYTKDEGIGVHQEPTSNLSDTWLPLRGECLDEGKSYIRKK